MPLHFELYTVSCFQGMTDLLLLAVWWKLGTRLFFRLFFLIVRQVQDVKEKKGGTKRLMMVIFLSKLR